MEDCFMKHREIQCILLAMILSAGVGYGKNCDPHNVYTNDVVKQDPPIEVKVYVTVDGKRHEIFPSSTGYSPLGTARAGSTVEFRVEAKDLDEHICEKDGTITTNLVLNKLVPTNINVSIEFDACGVSNKWEVPLIRTGTEWNFVWSNVWVVPSEAAGNELFMCFSGSIDDVDCNEEKHQNSHDTEQNLDGYKASLIVPLVEIVVIPEGMAEGDVLPEPVEIAAGAIESPAHRATVEIRVKPVKEGIPISVMLREGIGHEPGGEAVLRIGSHTLKPGMSAEVRTDAGGKISGVLRSSDTIETCLIHAEDAKRVVRFGWDEVWREDEWIIEPICLPVAGVKTYTATFRHYRSHEINAPWQPLAYHMIRFMVSRILYREADGSLVWKKWNEADLSAWAEFEQNILLTDENGMVSARLITKGRPELVHVDIITSDETVWEREANF
jgi:hypothetical protein